MNEVVSWIYGGDFSAAALKNESIHTDNLFAHEFDPLQTDQKGGNKVNTLCGLGKP